MKIIYIYFREIFLLLLIILINNKAFAQISGAVFDSVTIKNYQEKLYISTDREIYITGEQVWLKVYDMNGLTNAPASISKVVYFELLDGSNNPVNQLKIRVEETSGAAAFRLSDTLRSGNYLIRGYTNWMLNYPEDLFFYKTITVINPFKNISDLIINSSGKISDSSSFAREDKSQIKSLPDNNDTENGIKIKAKLQSDVFTLRDYVKLDITVSDLSGNPVKADLSVSVVKSFLAGNREMNFTNDFDYLSKTSHSYLPELEGQLISGIIKNKLTYEPLKNTDLSLSFVGKNARCQFGKTNDKGEFIFVVKEQYGLRELVIQPLYPEPAGSYVELNQPFCSTFIEYKPGAFNLDSSKTESINNAIISMQVSNIYEPFREKTKESTGDSVKQNFYGNPTHTIKLSDYIELTNIREVVKEILPEVTVLRRNKEHGLKIINSYPSQPFENQALILLDGVPVYDIESLLKVSSKDLERIDVINTRYFYNDYIFDGIVSFFTKKGNLSVFESDNSVYRQVYEGCQSRNSFYSPYYSTDSLKKSHIPDFRNTLFWKPDLKATKEAGSSVRFFTSDEKGNYVIMIVGMTSDGKYGTCFIPLMVK